MISPEKYLDELNAFLRQTIASDGKGEALSLEEGMTRAAALILSCGDAKVMVIGNGGSAAIAAHLQTDLCHTVGVRAMEFTASSLLTALSNDFAYEEAFPRLLSLWASPNDLLIAISSSGRSPNIVNAAAPVRERGCRMITFSGFHPDNPLRSLGDVNFYVPSHQYSIVETAHATLAHYLTDRASAARQSQRNV